MIILGIETSTSTGSVAVASENGIIALYSLNIEATHSERLMSTVDRVLKDAGMDLSRIDGFAVAIGPGSFTGLRIGAAAVKGLAFATGKPIAAVSTLEALAGRLAFSAYPVCPILDARKDEVYAALYRLDGSVPVPLMPEAVMPVGALSDKIEGKTVFTGEASRIYRKELEDLFGDRALFASNSAVLPSAAAVAELGLALLMEGKRTDPDELTPRYLRRPEAEVAWEKKQQQSR
jgi:tRNA threonylcarbamoyladenosine biosynthesis protein TsaB